MASSAYQAYESPPLFPSHHYRDSVPWHDGRANPRSPQYLEQSVNTETFQLARHQGNAHQVPLAGVIGRWFRDRTEGDYHGFRFCLHGVVHR